MQLTLAQMKEFGEDSCGETCWPFALLFAEQGNAIQGGENAVQRTQTYTNTTTSRDGTEEADTDWEEGT